MNLQSPLKAIRAKCLECSNESAKEVSLCPISACALYPFRFGKNPNRKRTLTEEEKQELIARFANQDKITP